MMWIRLTKSGTGKAYETPYPKGVSIAEMNVPHLNDSQVTLNYTAIDGVVVGVDLCHNGQERRRWLDNARRYL